MKNSAVTLQIERVFKALQEERSFLWTEAQLNAVQAELEELYAHFKNGETFLKYGKKQRILESTYMLTDSAQPLGDTLLGKEILQLQRVYDKL